MSKELEALKELRSYCEDAYYNKIYDKDYQIVETALKALEVIKEKGLDIREFRYAFSLYEYNICKNVGCKDLTEEEYNLLKGLIIL